MAFVAVGAIRIRKSIEFRVKRKVGFLAWWLRWGWRPYGAYQSYAMDKLAKRDPQRAVGGLWDYLGPMQLAVLRAFGLQPNHTVLDVGCGSLRGGRHLIRFLDPGNYTGLDISSELLRSANRLIQDEGLAAWKPQMLLTEGFKFREVDGRLFDIVHAFAVFTDIPIDLVEECFANLGKVLKPSGIFVATYDPGDHYLPDPVRIGFQYPLQRLQAIGREHGYIVEPFLDFQHPRGHQMVVARHQESMAASMP